MEAPTMDNANKSLFDLPNPFDPSKVLRGWDEILPWLGYSLSTTRRRKKMGLPIRYEPGSVRPILSQYEYLQWVREHTKKMEAIFKKRQKRMKKADNRT
jgi:hypothetical protein